ncbi:hypothetical protein IT413_04610 [Candidatus Peregrinibacteria bacterium]|nr:hypothetical protein [Candidatus Peregrinibacteria bacterium]
MPFSLKEFIFGKKEVPDSCAEKSWPGSKKFLSYEEERIDAEKNQIVLFDRILDNLESIPPVLLPEKEERIERYRALKVERLRMIAELEAKVARRKEAFAGVKFDAVQVKTDDVVDMNGEVNLDVDFEDVSPESLRPVMVARVQAVLQQDAAAE